MRHLQTKVGHLHTKGHGERYVGSLFRVDEPVPDDSGFHPSNQAKKLLNNKKLPKSLAVSSLILHRHLQVAQLAWASEPIEFGSAFVSIYGKASSCALFLIA